MYMQALMFFGDQVKAQMAKNVQSDPFSIWATIVLFWDLAPITDSNDLSVSVGSRDGSIALWCVQDPAYLSEDSQLKLCIKSPANKLYSALPQVYGKDKIRDLVYEGNSQVKMGKK